MKRIRSSLQPRRNAYLFSVRQDFAVGCGLLHRVSVCWCCWRCARGVVCPGQSGRSSFRKLFRHPAWARRHGARLPGRTHHFFHSHVGSADGFKHKATQPLDRVVCRHSRRGLHQYRITDLGNEHESRANVWFGGGGQHVDGALDLLHGTTTRHAFGR